MKMAPVLKTILKAFSLMVIICLSVFILVAIAIQIPVIQSKIVNAATTFVSNKTHTKVEIKNVSISFPKSVVIEGLYLEDPNRDTLLYTGKAKINLALFGLFVKKINISSVALEEATIRLHSSKTDPLFNYNFLLTAFSDTANQVKAEPATASKWTFSLDVVSLKNIRFTYWDEYAGMNVFATLKNSEFSVDVLDPEKSVYQFDELSAENLTVNVLRKESGNTTSSSEEKSTLPKIGAKKLQFSHSAISYIDSIGSISVSSTIGQSKFEDVTIDIQNELLNSGSIDLSNSQVQIHTFASELMPGSLNAPSGNNWKISGDRAKMKDNTFIYKSGNQPVLKSGFDPDYLEYRQLMLDAKDIFYSSDLMKASVNTFSATDQNNFSIARLEGDFSMDQHSIAIKMLKAETVNSSIDADFNIQFTSLAALTDSMQFSNLNLDLRNAGIKNSDAIYFNPDLIKLSFFKNKSAITAVSGKVNGPLNELNGKNIVIKTGSATIATTNFAIKGLPEYKTAVYDFPNLNIVSGKKDLIMLAGAYLPDSIDIPKNISVQLAFKGQIKSFETSANMTSSFGAGHLMASIDPNENFSGQVNLDHLDIGRFLKDTIRYGPVSLTAEVKGKGLDMKTVQAKIKADAPKIYLNQYTYHNLNLDGTASGKQFEGKISLNDENAVFDFEGLVNLKPNQEHYRFKFDVKGANLQKLKLTEKDARVSFVATADLKGGSGNPMNGSAGIFNIIIASNGKKYMLDSFLSASVNEPGKSKLNVNRALIGINYSGTISPDAIPGVLSQFINNYFPLSDSILQVKNSTPSKFNFEIQLHNHPVISEWLVPQLKEFEPGTITGSFDSEKSEIKIDATMNKLVYGSTAVKGFVIKVNSDKSELNYQISSPAISNSQVKLDNFLLEGKLAGNKILASISSTDGKNKKLLLRSQLTKENENYKLIFDPKDFYLMNNRWGIAADNFIEFGKQGFRVHHLFIDHAGNQVNIASVHDRFNDDLNIAIRNFRLDDLSQIVEKDTSLVRGTLDGNLLLKQVNNAYGLVADATISNLIVREIPIGNMSLKADNPEGKKFDFDVNLSGPDNRLTAKGYYIPNGGDQAIRIETAIQSLSMKTLEAFSMGQITEAAGTLTGNILTEGNAGMPDISGELVFNNAFLKPSFLNNRLELKHETIELKKDGVYFKTFTMLDGDQHTAIIDGSVQMKQFSDFVFALQVNTSDFLLFNTTARNNKEFFGRMVIDSKIQVNGPMDLPVVNAKVKMKKGSNFTFSVPEDKLTTDKGEDVVEFDNSVKLNPILLRADKTGGQTSGMTGFDLSSIIEVDKEATLRLLMDPASADSLVVKGEAALSFTMDQSGKMSLTGAYNLNEGSYLVSLESVIKKKFDIDAGSTIIWNGDPMDAEISINASYSVRASPYDLVADQLSGRSDADKSGYKQRYPFHVILKLRGKILHPEISFAIQLRPEDKGIMDGAVDQKLSMLNEDPSALNKQVFALLVLNRFVQENPFQSETAGTSALIRSTVSKFLSNQINQLSSKVLPGMEVNFDIQSYNDYQTGQAKGRTQVEIGVKKQLFNERLSVQLGGAIDVEGDRAKQNSASDITSDVTIEYKLNKDGSLRLKGFRHNQYEGAIEGQLVETGTGVVFVRDFNRWKRLFKKPPKTLKGDGEKAPLNKKR